MTADAVLRAARGADRALISGVSLFDVYQGDRLPAGKQSLAIEVVFQPRERTLTDAEIEARQSEGRCSGGQGNGRHAALMAGSSPATAVSAAWAERTLETESLGGRAIQLAGGLQFVLLLERLQRGHGLGPHVTVNVELRAMAFSAVCTAAA